MGSARHSLNTIEAFIRQIGRIKAAEEAHTEPGSIGGPTDHPSADVDDRTDEVEVGERYEENAEDVVEDQGDPSVDATPVAKASYWRRRFKRSESEHAPVSQPGSAADDHYQIGTEVRPTGEHPDVETESAKDTKDDGSIGGESSHPARTDNDELDGQKYSSDLHKIAAELQRLGERICTRLMGYSGLTPIKTAQAFDGDDLAAAAYNAGWEAADLAYDKIAADAYAHTVVSDIIKQAEDDATEVATYLDSFCKTATASVPENEPTTDEIGALLAESVQGEDEADRARAEAESAAENLADSADEAADAITEAGLDAESAQALVEALAELEQGQPEQAEPVDEAELLAALESEAQEPTPLAESADEVVALLDQLGVSPEEVINAANAEAAEKTSAARANLRTKQAMREYLAELVRRSRR